MRTLSFLQGLPSSFFPFSKIHFGVIFLFVVFIHNNAFTQVQSNELYLNPLIKEINDTHKARKYKEAEALADKCLKKFSKEKNHKDFVEALFLKGKVTMHQYRIDESLMWYDSSANFAKNHNLNYHYLCSLNAQADILNYQNKNDLAIEKSMMVLEVKNQNPTEYSEAYQSLSTSYLAKGIIDSTDKYTILTFQNDTTNNLTDRIAYSTTRLGEMYARRGENEKAIITYMKALDLVPKEKETRKNRTYLNLADAFFDIQNLKKSEQYLKLSLQLSEANNLKSSISNAVYRLGNIEEIRGNHLKAIEYFNRILLHYKNTKNKKMKAHSYLGLAKSYFELDKIEDARIVLNEIQSGIEDSDNDQLKLKYYVVQSLFYSKTGKKQETIQMLTKAEKMANETKNLFRQRDVYKIYSDFYLKNGNSDLAFSNLQNYHRLKDSIYQLQQSYIVHDLDSKYQKAEQDLQIQKLDAEKVAMNEKLSSRNIAIGVGGFILLLGTLLSFIIFSLYKKNKEKAAELSDKNQLLSKALNEKEFLIKEIHHRVKNNLQIVSSLLSLQARNISDPTALDALKEGQSRVRSMALIHQNLYQDDDLIGVDAKAYIEKLSEGLFHSYNIDNDRIQLHSEIENVKLDVNTIIPLGLIINELITNALKYAFDKNKMGNINLSLKKEKNQLVFSISDDGKGLPESFSLEKNKTLGYRLIKAFSQKLEAALSIDGKNGTKISLLIPHP